MNKKSLPLVAALLSSTIFAFAFFFTTKALGAVGGNVPKMLAFRLTIAVAAMTALWWAGLFKMHFAGKDLRPLILCGLLVPSIGFLCEYYALGNGWTTSGQIAMFYAMMPIVVTAMGIFMLGEKPAPRQYIFMGISVAGLVIINWGINFEATHPFGLLLPAVAVLCACLNSILLRGTAGQFAAIETVYVTSVVGMCAFTALSVIQHLVTGTLGSFFEGIFSWPFAVGIFYLSIISSIFGFMMSNYMVAQLPPVVSSSFSGLSTILTITVGVLLLHEKVRWVDAVGCAFILAGALLMNAGYRQPPLDLVIRDEATDTDNHDPETNTTQGKDAIIS